MIALATPYSPLQTTDTPAGAGGYAEPEATGQQVIAISSNDMMSQTVYQTGRFYQKIRLMRRNPTINLARELVIAPLLAAGWSVEETEDAPEDAREFIKKQVERIRLPLLQQAMLGCLDFGWQPFEKVLEFDDMSGYFGFKKFKPLLQDMTNIKIFRSTGAYAGLINFETDLDIEQTFLTYFYDSGTNFFGKSMSEVVEHSYDQWVQTNEANARYNRKVAGAHWVINYPTGSTPYNGVITDNGIIAKALLAQLESSGSIAIPSDVSKTVEAMTAGQSVPQWRIELMGSDASTNAGFIDRLKYLDACMVRSYGLPERAVLEGQFGTKAEAEAHGDFAIVNMELRHALFCMEFNWHCVNHLLRLNWGPQYENTVFVKPNPIADATLEYARTIYQAILTNPAGFNAEFDGLDLNALRDKVSMPSNPDAIDEPQPLVPATVTGGAPAITPPVPMSHRLAKIFTGK